MQDITHLLNRIAFGPRPGDVERVKDIGIERYLDAQFHPERIDDKSMEARLTGFSSIQMTTPQLLDTYQRPRRVAQMRPSVMNAPQDMLRDLQAQKLIRAVHSQRQL